MYLLLGTIYYETMSVSVFRNSEKAGARDPFTSIVGHHILIRSSEADTKCSGAVMLGSELYLPTGHLRSRSVNTRKILAPTEQQFFKQVFFIFSPDLQRVLSA